MKDLVMALGISAPSHKNFDGMILERSLKKKISVKNKQHIFYVDIFTNDK